MNQNKTRATQESVADFLESIADPQRREDARTLCAALERATGEPPLLWGDSMIGFGRYRYRYDSGREGEWFPVGFSPRARELVVYLLADGPEQDSLLSRLGRHRMGKSCLYIKRLADIDMDVLQALIAGSLAAIRERHPD